MNVSGINSLASQAMSSLGTSGLSITPPSQEEVEAGISEFVSELDTDGNGTVSLEESGVSEESFSAIDTDGDGEISAEELMAYLEANRPAQPPPPPASEEEDEEDEDDLLTTLSVTLETDSTESSDSEGGILEFLQSQDAESYTENELMTMLLAYLQNQSEEEGTQEDGSQSKHIDISV